MPESFTDKKGRKYIISLNLGEVRRLREAQGIDLLHEQHWQELMQSLLRRLDYIRELLKYQLEELDLDNDEFDELLMKGTMADDASDALLAELVSFYRRLNQKKLVTVTQKLIEAQAREREMVKQDGFSKAIDAAMKDAEQQTTG